ncbi:MAG: hypothetical protein ACK4N5_18645, partial [Myxococcales bacterium]
MHRDTFGAGGPRAELLKLPIDRLGFVRRECGSCHRQFKVRETELDGEVVFNRVAGQVEHCNEHESGCSEGLRTCPYCGARGGDDAWFTAEQRAWLDKRAETFGEELRFEQLSHVERTLSQNPYPTFLAVRPQPSATQLRAEPDDMRVVPMLCCGDSVKISESWVGPLNCFYCGCEHEYGEVLVRQRLAKIMSP